MTQVKVIMTKDVVYTTFYKTIHAREVYANDVDKDRHNDPATQSCRSLAFSLACSTTKALCEVVDMTSKKVTDSDIFEYLNKCH